MKRITFLCIAFVFACISTQVQGNGNNLCVTGAVPFGAGNLVVMKFEQDPAFTALNSYYAASMIIEEYKIEADGSLTLIQSFNMPETTEGSNHRMFGIPRSTFSGTMTRSNDGQYIVTYGYDAEKGTTLNYNTGINAQINPIVFARIAVDGTINSTTNLKLYKSEVSGVASNDGSAFYFTGNMETSNRGLGYLLLNDTTASSLMSAADLTAMGGIRTLRYEKNFLMINSWAKTYSITDTVMPPVDQSVVTEIIPKPASGSSYSFCIVDTDPLNPGTKLVMYQPNDNMGVFKFSLVDGQWVNNGICLTSVAATTGTLLKSIVGKKSGENVELYMVENDKYNGRLLKFTDYTGYNVAVNPTTTDASLTVLKDYTGTDYSIRSVSWAPEVKASTPVISVTDNQENLLKVYSNKREIIVENNTMQLYKGSVYNIVGSKVKDIVVQNGKSTISMNAGNNSIYIVRINGKSYKVFFNE